MAGILTSTQTLYGGATGGGIRQSTKLIELQEGRTAKKPEAQPEPDNNAAKIAELQKRQQALLTERRKLQKELKGKAKANPRFKEIIAETRATAKKLQQLRRKAGNKRNAGGAKQSGPLAMGAIEGRPARGNADGEITIVEWSDFQCPYCARGADVVEEVIWPKIPSKMAKFHLQIVENRLKFQSKILPCAGRRPRARPDKLNRINVELMPN